MSSRPQGPGAPLITEAVLPFKERVKRAVHAAFDPLTAFLARLGVAPDGVTFMGFLVSLVASLAFFEGSFRFGAAMVALSGVCDILDGELARRTHHRSRFGAFLDSTLDRVSDGMVLAGIAGFYLVHLLLLVLVPAKQLADNVAPQTWAVVSLTAILAMLGSFMVSYTRARAEGLGVECKVGWFERPVRMVLIIVAGAFGVGWVMSAALILLALLSFATVVQRVVYVWKHTRGAGLDS